MFILFYYLLLKKIYFWFNICVSWEIECPDNIASDLCQNYICDYFSRDYLTHDILL